MHRNIIKYDKHHNIDGVCTEQISCFASIQYNRKLHYTKMINIKQLRHSKERYSVH